MQAVGLLAGGDRPRFQQSSNRDDRFLRSPPAMLSARITSVLRCHANQTEGQSRGLLGAPTDDVLAPANDATPAPFFIAKVLTELSNLLRRLLGETIELNVVHGRDLGYFKVDK